MSLSLARIKEAVYNWITNETDDVLEEGHVIWRNQSEPLPGRPCVTMKITDGPRRVGYGDSMTYVKGNRFNIGGQREMTVSIQVYGNSQITDKPKASQIALDLNSSLSKPSVLAGLRAAGLAVQRQGDPSNISALEETEYEERAQFDVLFGLAQNVLDDPGTIEKVNIHGKVDTTEFDVPVDGS